MSSSHAPRRRKASCLTAAESTLHFIEVLGCIFPAASAMAHGESPLVWWSLTALLTSLLSLYLLHCRRDIYLHGSVREWLYAAMRLHRAFAIVSMRRVLATPLLDSKQAAGHRIFFAKAVLVNSSILPILLQALVLQLPLQLQVAVQVVVASIILRAMPAYCTSLAGSGMHPSHFEWLASLQGNLSSIVMAATSSSRGTVLPVDVPCSVSLSHLVLVFEVVVPCLVTYYLQLAAQSRHSGGGSGREGVAGAIDSGTPVSAGAGSAAAQAAGGSATIAASGDSDGGSDTSSDGSRLGAASAGMDDRQQRERRALLRSYPSAILVLLVAVGVSGVLYDVVLTMHLRGAARLN